MSVEFDVERDYYSILGTDEKATLEELKMARKSLVLQYHPDVNSSADAAIRFRAIQDAYEILSDSVSRAKYDAGRNKFLTKTLTTEAAPIPGGFITQQQNFNMVRRNASSSWQAIASNRLKTPAWQKMPLAAKKVPAS